MKTLIKILIYLTYMIIVSMVIVSLKMYWNISLGGLPTAIIYALMLFLSRFTCKRYNEYCENKTMYKEYEIMRKIKEIGYVNLRVFDIDTNSEMETLKLTINDLPNNYCNFYCSDTNTLYAIQKNTDGKILRHLTTEIQFKKILVDNFKKAPVKPPKLDLNNLTNKSPEEVEEAEAEYAEKMYEYISSRIESSNNNSHKSIFKKANKNIFNSSKAYAIFIGVCLAVSIICVILNIKNTSVGNYSFSSNNELEYVTAYGRRTASETVYISKTGVMYHKKDCYIISSPQPITIEEAINKGYKPCSICKP